MPMPQRANASEIVELDVEKVYDEVALLTSVKRHYTKETSIIQGEHPDHGHVVIVVPAIGDSLMIPVSPLGLPVRPVMLTGVMAMLAEAA